MKRLSYNRTKKTFMITMSGDIIDMEFVGNNRVKYVILDKILDSPVSRTLP